MLAKLRPRLTYANVVSTICLFVVLGGTAYAAGINIPINSIGGLQIKQDAVGASEIKKNAVGASEIKKNAVGSAEIKTGAVTASDIQDKSLKLKDFKPEELPEGPPGARGTPGVQGAQGEAGATNVVRRVGSLQTCNTNGCVTPAATANCLAGETAISGGGVNATTLDTLSESEPAGPINNPTGWTVKFVDGPDADTGSNATPVVLCASP